MLVVETVARIRREFFVKGRTIKEIARELKLARNTGRKVLHSCSCESVITISRQPASRAAR